jgi:hypothetical protein
MKWKSVLAGTLAVWNLVGCAPAEQDLSNRIEYSNEELAIGDVQSQSLLGGLTLTLVGTAGAPTVGGSVLGATMVVANGNYVYVSYNQPGPVRLGALETINVSNSTRPVSVQLFSYTGYNVNAMFVDDDYLYLVGAQSDNINPAAYLKVLKLVNNLPTTEVVTIYLPSYAANAVFAKNGYIYVSSGDTGGLTVIKRSTLQIVASSKIYDSRAIASPVFNNEIMVLGAQTGRVQAYRTSAITNTPGQNLNPSFTLPLGGATIPESKSTLQIGVTMGLASLGAQGFKLFCLLDGKTLSTQSVYPDLTVDTSKNVTNAATIDGGMIYSGNGEAGIQVYSALYAGVNLFTCDPVNVTRLGKITLGAGVSVNHVLAANDMLYVAAGIGGFKIVKVNPPFLIGLLRDFNISILDYIIAPVINLFTGGNLFWSNPTSNRTFNGTTYW